MAKPLRVQRSTPGWAGASAGEEGLRVLLVDADAGRAAMVSAGLEAAGYEVVALASDTADLTRLASQPLAFAAAAGLGEMAGEMAGETTVSAELPGFANLLHLTELLPNVLEVLSDHTDTLVGYTWVEGGTRRSLTRLTLR